MRMLRIKVYTLVYEKHANQTKRRRKLIINKFLCMSIFPLRGNELPLYVYSC